MRNAYIATIQVAIKCDSEAQACDGISECLSTLQADEAILDWQYLKLGGQYCAPTYKPVAESSKYIEGDAFK